MLSIPKNPIIRGLVLCLIIMLLFVPSVAQVQAGTNPFLTLFIAIGFGLVGLIIYDAVSCQLNILFSSGCSSRSGGSGGSGGSGSTSINSGGSRGNKGGGGGQNGGGQPVGGSNPVSCRSVATNACGMHGQSFKLSDGSCPATPPANSACPVPVINSSTGFYANPDRVRTGGATTLHWTVVNATICSLTGGGLSLSGLGIIGTNPTSAINQKTEFTLTCQNGAAGPNGVVGGPTASATAVVNLVPAYQEI